MLNLAIYNHMNEYGKVIRLSEEAIDFFARKPYRNTSVTQVFYYSLLAANLHQQAYTRCRKVVAKYNRVFSPGSYNWFKWQELHLLAEMHAGQYPAAIAIWQAVTARPEYRELPLSISNFWVSTETFLHFLSRCDHWRGKPFQPATVFPEKHFREEEQNFIRVPTVLTEFLLALAQKDHLQCSTLQRSLKNYRKEKLSLRNAPRSYYFLQMLELASQNLSQPIVLERKSLALCKKMQQIPWQVANQDLELEIIPYETLWKLVLEQLKSPQQL